MCLMILSGCGYSNVASESFESMDTFMKIDIYSSGLSSFDYYFFIFIILQIIYSISYKWF